MKKKIKFQVIFGILLCIFPLSMIFVSFNLENHFNNNKINLNPKPSNNFDIIITPENKIYNESMNGYYPGAYSFEDEITGTIGSQIDFVDFSWHEWSTIIDELDGHKKVLKISRTDHWEVVQHFFDDSFMDGTYEMWFRVEDAYQRNRFTLSEIYGTDMGNPIVYLIVETNNLWFVDNSSISNSIMSFASDKWYHIRIDIFSDNTFNLIIDQVPVLLKNATTNEMTTGVNGTFFKEYENPAAMYLDAVGYTTCPNYVIGDNLDEGLLLSFENISEADWIGYSLDGVSPITIKGNTTLPMLTESGTHTIQLFWNNASGNYQSDIREFYINTRSKYIITPENKVYSEPMAGYYPATYGFEKDADGEVPSYFVDESFSGCSATISPEVDGHKKVIDNYDPTTSGHASLRLYLPSPQTSGTIEFWIRCTNAFKPFNFYLMNETDGQLTIFHFAENQWYYPYSGWNVIPELGAAKDNYWHHVGIDFECTTGNYAGLPQYCFRFRVDDLSSNVYPFAQNCSSFDHILYHTSISNTNYHVYLDALAFSWDPNYIIGDNLNEGLLLGIQESDKADWMGYSLDEEQNVTIEGNTTLIMPADGPHAIQLFWNNSNGYFSTDLREFWVDSYTTILVIEFVDQSFTSEEFLITFSVKSSLGININSANIDAWWNGDLVSGQVEKLADDGLYQISLTATTVMPGEPPILLRMVVFAEGYQQKEIEVYLAIDPAVINKLPPDNIALIITIIIFGGSIASAAIVLSIGIVRTRSKRFERKRKGITIEN